MTALSAFGPGKVILLGEHAVVYGQPALAGALSWGVTATASPARKCRLELPAELARPSRQTLRRAFARAAALAGEPAVRVSVQSDLPLSMGLGSSAAFSVACARVLLGVGGRRPSDLKVSQLAGAMEEEFHGTPSGVDHTTSARAQLLWFRRRGRGRPETREVRSRRPLEVLVALVGPRRATRATVASLRERAGRWRGRYQRLFEEIGALADEGATAVERGDFHALGDLMNINQGLLAALQLSSPAIEQLVYRLRDLGALGAKLTGAGGDGGAVIGLFLEPERAVARLTAEGIRCFCSQLGGPRTP